MTNLYVPNTETSSLSDLQVPKETQNTEFSPSRLRRSITLAMLGLAPLSLLALGNKEKEQPLSKADPVPVTAKVTTAELGFSSYPAQHHTVDPVDPAAPLSELGNLVSPENLSRALRSVVQKVTPSVAMVIAKQPQSTTPASLGSGVVSEINGSPCILTNAHVVGDASAADVRVRLADGRTYTAEKVFKDTDSDVAVVTLSPSVELKAAELGDAKELGQGDFVLLMGHPFEQAFSVSFGIASAVDRHGQVKSDGNVINRYQDYIQTDAAMNPGNSGGALVSLSGKVMGLNNYIASQSGGSNGVGFAISINLAKRVAEDLLEHGKVIRPLIGVSLESVTGEIPVNEPEPSFFYGASRVTSISPNSPAANAGLKTNDVVVAMNGQRIHSNLEFIDDIAMQRVGSRSMLTVIRDGTLLELPITFSQPRND